MNALARWQKAALAITVVGFVALIGGIAIDPPRALTNLLIGAFLVLGLSAGGMAVLCLLTVANAGWAVVLRRVLEGFGSFLPLAALLLLATTPGLRVLYEWARPAAAHDPLLASKAAFLNPTFFLVRMVVILGAWLFFTQRLQAISRAQDTRDDVALTRATVRWAAGFIVVFAITVCLASFDWIMTLEARWFSTIFGFYNIAGILVSTCAALAIATILLSRAGVLPELKPAHLHDVGKLMFAFSTFWAYQWISQFLLIWYSNIPEETVYFEARWENGWLPVFFLNLLVNWVLPFLLLLPREAKREPKRLLPVAILLMCGRWLDLWLMAMPGNFSVAPVPGIFELAGILGPVGLFAFWVSRRFARVPLIVRHDPYLQESLHHNT